MVLCHPHFLSPPSYLLSLLSQDRKALELGWGDGDGKGEELALRKQESEHSQVVAMPVRKATGEFSMSIMAAFSVSSQCMIQFWLRWPHKHVQYNAPRFVCCFFFCFLFLNIYSVQTFPNATEDTDTFFPLKRFRGF